MPMKFLSYAEINLYNSDNEKSVVNSEFSCNNIPLSSTVTASTKRHTVQKEESSKGTCKKPKKGPSSSSMGTIMIRKQKLGDRIATLQQLVSPFGKSDTASVLQETLEYIRFLQDQIQYAAKRKDGSGNNDLRLRGLCIVPVSCIKEVESEDDVAAYSYAPTTQTSFFSESE